MLAPLPVVSLYGGFALNEQWSVGARLDLFSLTYEQYHGGITVLGLNLLYQPFRHVGFGVGYTGLFLNFQADSTRAGLVSRKVQPERAGPHFLPDRKFLTRPCLRGQYGVGYARSLRVHPCN